MKVRMSLLGALLFAAVALPAFPETVQQQADPPLQAPATNGTQTATLPPQSHGSAPLRVMVGKSLLINTTDKLRRASLRHLRVLLSGGVDDALQPPYSGHGQLADHVLLR